MERWPKGGCVCQARLHPLITNCLNCGKIICGAEVDLNCSYCGKPLILTDALTASGENELLNKLKKTRAKYSIEKERADKFVDRLIKADENNAQSAIIDDSIGLSNRYWMRKAEIEAEEIAYKEKLQREKEKGREILLNIPLRK